MLSFKPLMRALAPPILSQLVLTKHPDSLVVSSVVFVVNEQIFLWFFGFLCIPLRFEWCNPFTNNYNCNTNYCNVSNTIYPLVEGNNISSCLHWEFTHIITSLRQQTHYTLNLDSNLLQFYINILTLYTYIPYHFLFYLHIYTHLYGLRIRDYGYFPGKR